MASSRNGGGMRILWIPGRKKHDRKGIYAGTSKEVNKNYLPQRKNQVWSLGGVNEQRKLINVSVTDDACGSTCAISIASHGAHNGDPSLLAVASTSAVKDNPSDSNDKLNLDENLIEEEKIVDKEILKNGDAACNTDNIDVDIEDDMKAYHNSATIRYRKKTGSNNTDLDSIEHLDSEDDETKKNDGNLEDDIDSVSVQRMRSENASARRRRKNKNRNKREIGDDDKKENNEKVVDCLYLGIMCCECIIC